MSCEQYRYNFSAMIAAMNYTNHEVNTADQIHYVFDQILLPAVCSFGIVGNILNLAVLTRKQLQNSMDRMEKSSHLGLVALALSDLLFCLCALPYAFLDNQKYNYFPSESLFFLYYKFAHTAVLNTFLYCSTWLTVVMASARYLAICHPLHARQFINLTATKISIVMVFLVSVLFNIPWFWHLRIFKRKCASECPCYTIKYGNLFVRETFEYSFSITYALLAVFMPIIILTFCNICLIRALRQSMQMQRKYRVNRPKQDSGHHITPTLIVIIILFMTLVIPSELVKFLAFIIEKKGVQMEPLGQTAFNIASVITNFMQSCNFAVNFVLYCILNVHFRKTIAYVLCCRWKEKIELRRRSTRNPTVTLMTDIETDTI